MVGSHGKLKDGKMFLVLYEYDGEKFGLVEQRGWCKFYNDEIEHESSKANNKMRYYCNAFSVDSATSVRSECINKITEIILSDSTYKNLIGSVNLDGIYETFDSKNLSGEWVGMLVLFDNNRKVGLVVADDMETLQIRESYYLLHSVLKSKVLRVFSMATSMYHIVKLLDDKVDLTTYEFLREYMEEDPVVSYLKIRAMQNSPERVTLNINIQNSSTGTEHKEEAGFFEKPLEVREEIAIRLLDFGLTVEKSAELVGLKTYEVIKLSRN